MESVEVTIGRQVWGSGCYRAGYNVLEGDVTEEPIDGTHIQSRFVESHKVVVKPKTKTAIIEAYSADALREPWRKTFTLTKEGV